MSVTLFKAVSSTPAASSPAQQPWPAMSFDVSDLFYYYSAGHTPTGIQRVQQELCLELLRHEKASATLLVIYDRAIQKWRLVPGKWLLALLETARTFRPAARSWSEVYQELAVQLTTFPLKQFESGEWLVNVGASWSLASYFVQIRQLRRRGVRIGVFLHDCIPVRHPAYFEHFHAIEHSHWLAHVRECADLVICNSEATRNDYVDLVQPPPSQNLHICRLDAAWEDNASSPDAEIAVSELLSDLGAFEDDFVLAVGTIEPRKNHLTLVHVWDQLRHTHPENCPKLLCVGRIGWKSDAVIAQAKALGLLNHKIHFLSGLPDEVLQGLYRKCLFSMYVSYYEGWGLPITESLAAGKVCIAGSNSSLCEAGAGYAIHVDERSETSIHEAVARLIDNPTALVEANRRIRQEYRPRQWTQVLSEFTDILTDAAKSEPLSTALPVLDTNVLYQFGRPEPVKDFEKPKAAEVFCAGNMWHQPEAWGTWTSKELSEIAFRVKSEHERPALFLGLNAPPGGAAITVQLNGKQAVSFPHFTGKKIVRLSLEDVNSASDLQFTPVRLRISSSRVQNMREIANSQDSRMLGVGYLFVIAFDRTSIFERLEFMEKVVTNEI
jgi:glycosyltransferase involved in cell wall biosynthesis